MTRNYLEAFVIAILAAGIGFFLLWPKYVELRAAEQKIIDKNAELENRNEYYANLERISASLNDHEDGLAKIKSAFPDNSDSPALMSFVQATAMQSGMIVKGISYSGAGANQAAGVISGKSGSGAPIAGVVAKHILQNYSVSLGLTGSYGNFKDFLSRIQRSSRMISLGKITINTGKSAAPEAAKGAAAASNKGGSEAADPLFDYTLSLSANYYQ